MSASIENVNLSKKLSDIEFGGKKYMKRNEILYMILIIIFINFFIYYGYRNYGRSNFEINLVSEIIGIITTVFLIDWIYKKRKERSLLPLKEALFSKISRHCDVILTILAEEDILHYHFIDERPGEQLKKDKEGLLESIKIGSEVLSVEFQDTLLKLTDIVERSISMTEAVPTHIRYKQDLRMAEIIKNLFEIMGNPEMIRKTEGTIERIQYYVDRDRIE